MYFHCRVMLVELALKVMLVTRVSLVSLENPVHRDSKELKLEPDIVYHMHTYGLLLVGKF